MQSNLTSKTKHSNNEPLLIWLEVKFFFLAMYYTTYRHRYECPFQTIPPCHRLAYTNVYCDSVLRIAINGTTSDPGLPIGHSGTAIHQPSLLVKGPIGASQNPWSSWTVPLSLSPHIKPSTNTFCLALPSECIFRRLQVSICLAIL